MKRLIAIPILLGVVLIAFAFAGKHEMAADNKAVVHRYFDEFSKGNLDAVKAIMAPNHVFHFPLSPAPMDREAHSQAQRMVHAAFPDFHIVIADQFAHDDKVVTRGFIRGTHKGDFQGMPPSGKSIDVPVTNVMKIVDGMNVEEWDSFDTLGFMQQLGALPAPGESGNDMMLEKNKALARHYYAELDRQKGAPTDIFTPNVMAYFAGNPPMDLEGLRQFGVMFYSAFPDLKHDLEYVIAEGDRVFVGLTAKGTHKGDFMGISPTGKQISIAGFNILRIVDGKVVEHRAVIDQLSMMKQLGLLPMPEDRPKSE